MTSRRWKQPSSSRRRNTAWKSDPVTRPCRKNLREPANDRPPSCPPDAWGVYLHHPARFPDRLHLDRDGRGFWLLRLLHARSGLLRQPGVLPADAEHLQRHEQRRADGDTVIPVHGLHGRTIEHSRSPVLQSSAVFPL